MNNRNNNRRRGRGNRQQGSGPVNRIDSRARGNAPQMLDKYKKLAQDAQHNGDRVQAEYYLQFADHYFRVIADNRLRQEESRNRHQDQRQRGRDDDDDSDDDAGERDNWQNNRQPRQRTNGYDRNGRSDEDDARHQADDRDDDSADAQGATEQDNRPRRGRPPREDGQRTPRGRRPRSDDGAAEIDAAVLPPAFKVGTEEDAEAAKPAPRRRTRKAASDDGDKPVRAVG